MCWGAVGVVFVNGQTRRLGLLNGIGYSIIIELRKKGKHTQRQPKRAVLWHLQGVAPLTRFQLRSAPLIGASSNPR